MGFALAVVELTGVELELEPLVPRSHRRCAGPEAHTLSQHGDRELRRMETSGGWRPHAHSALKRSRQENASQVSGTAQMGDNYVSDAVSALSRVRRRQWHPYNSHIAPGTVTDHVLTQLNRHTHDTHLGLISG